MCVFSITDMTKEMFLPKSFRSNMTQQNFQGKKHTFIYIVLPLKISQIYHVILDYFAILVQIRDAEPHSAVGSFVDLRTGGRWFDPRLGQYSFRRLMIVIAAGFIPLSQLSVVTTMVMWESSPWIGKNIVRSAC